MSCDYASGLSDYPDKGRLGLPEIFDSPEVVQDKVSKLVQWVTESEHVVFHTGAGISTSAGIPDFRGPKGVWTLEKKGRKPDTNLSWDEARPTKTHMALKTLLDGEGSKFKFVVSQNIDGLHLRSGIRRQQLAELHGNMFVDKCSACEEMFVRPNAAETVGQKCSGIPCTLRSGDPESKCRGKLRDFTLDWEHELPEADLKLSEAHSVLADMNIVLGSTLQIVPSGLLPTLGKKYASVNRSGRSRLVIVNLQATKYDRRADLVIRAYVDDVMKALCSKLNIPIPEYDPESDPIRLARTSDLPINWTQSEEEAKRVFEQSSLLEKALKEKRKNDRISKRKCKSNRSTKRKSDEDESTPSVIPSKLMKEEHFEVKPETDSNVITAKEEKPELEAENGSMPKKEKTPVDDESKSTVEMVYQGQMKKNDDSVLVQKAETDAMKCEDQVKVEKNVSNESTIDHEVNKSGSKFDDKKESEKSGNTNIESGNDVVAVSVEDQENHKIDEQKKSASEMECDDQKKSDAKKQPKVGSDNAMGNEELSGNIESTIDNDGKNSESSLIKETENNSGDDASAAAAILSSQTNVDVTTGENNQRNIEVGKPDDDDDDISGSKPKDMPTNDEVNSKINEMNESSHHSCNQESENDNKTHIANGIQEVDDADKEHLSKIVDEDHSYTDANNHDKEIISQENEVVVVEANNDIC